MNDILETETPVMVSPRWDMLLDAGEDTARPSRPRSTRSSVAS